MAVLMILDWQGATTDQYDAVNDAMGIHGDADAPDGLISHACAVADDGSLVIADVWESPEKLDTFVRERLTGALQQAGLTEELTPRIIPVHNHLQGSAPDAAVAILVEAEAGPDVYDAMVADMGPDAAAGTHPAHSHAAAFDGSTMVVVDLWPSAEAFGQFAEKNIGPAGAKHGLTPDAMRIRQLRLHNMMKGKAAAAV